MELQGLKVLITGGSRGIGRATALSFAREGCDVAVNYLHSANKAREVVEEIESVGRKAIAIRADVSISDDCEMMVEQVVEAFGRIDVLVNNAGVFPRHFKIIEITEEEWDWMLSINLKGTFNVTKLVVPWMIERRFGRIINVASIAGKSGGTVGVAYAASKAGIIGFTRALARELAPYGITVNAVAPGPVDTDFLSPEFKEKAAKLSPQGRIAKPEEIAHTIVFLAENDHITGEVINVNGGRYMD
ncbi:MAG TPA: 3-oxoacyl-ACP reductase FabG [Candidatus Korarchaeota archaeon]|nr:3-oxoacyl-ACP reductase FabG [Candidatus Korarchaeota archaeon]